ncbi:MAG: hypothetical protein ACUVTH_12745 [Thermogutta sp.]
MVWKKTLVLLFIPTVIIPLCMLGLGESPSARVSSNAEQPFANSVEQRAAMISELRAIREILSDQNTILREQNKLLAEQLGLLKKTAIGEIRRESDSTQKTNE